MEYQTIRLATEGQLAVLTLNRPDRRNSLSPAMIAELLDALASIEGGDSRVAILTGEGLAFCAGMDLDALRAIANQSPEENLEDSRRTAGLFRRLWSFPKPLIAAVNGAAVAGGCGIATLCDFTIAAREAMFGYTEVRIGFVPALVSVFLQLQVGEKVARDLLLSGRLIDTVEAQKIGLVTRVVHREQLLETAREVARQIVANSPAALAATKRLLVEANAAEVDRKLDLAIAANAGMRKTKDFREGLSSFLERRKPEWSKP